MNYLLASLGFFFLFCWAIGHGMFRDIERPKYTMLENERRLDVEDGEDLGLVLMQRPVEGTSLMAKLCEKTTAEEENTYHYYTGNAIPWFVRATLDPVLVRRDHLRRDVALAGAPVRAARPAMTTRSRRPVCDYCELPLPASWWSAPLHGGPDSGGGALLLPGMPDRGGDRRGEG